MPASASEPRKEEPPDVAHDLDARQLADWLGGGPTAVSDLSLCSTPDPRPVVFERDVQRIARHARCDPDRLKGLLREVRPAR